jgi:hypothetical protein
MLYPSNNKKEKEEENNGLALIAVFLIGFYLIWYLFDVIKNGTPEQKSKTLINIILVVAVIVISQIHSRCTAG